LKPLFAFSKSNFAPPLWTHFDRKLFEIQFLQYQKFPVPFHRSIQAMGQHINECFWQKILVRDKPSVVSFVLGSVQFMAKTGNPYFAPSAFTSICHSVP
jgi:hypothetical protein